MLPSSLPLTVGGNDWMEHRPWHAQLTQNCCQEAQNICFGLTPRMFSGDLVELRLESKCCSTVLLAHRRHMVLAGA